VLRNVSRVITLAIVVTLVARSSVSAQDAADRAQVRSSFSLGAQVTSAQIGELDATDVGVGARAAWQPLSLPLLGLEGELNFYPRNVPSRVAVSSSRVEGIFGVTAGPRIDRWRPFARFRTGFLRVGEAPGPIACILIFPPPLSCTLAAGATLLTWDVGGGIEVDLARRTFMRVDVGDRMTRYPGLTIGPADEILDDHLVGHDLRVAIGAGWRF